MKSIMVVVMLVLSTAALADAPKLEVGMVAPDFSAKDQNGKEVSLKDYLGKSAVALCFYPKALTGG